MDNTRQFATQLVTDLLDQHIIARDVVVADGGTWRIVKPFFGLTTGTYPDKAALIQAIVEGVMNAYGVRLKSA